MNSLPNWFKSKPCFSEPRPPPLPHDSVYVLVFLLQGLQFIPSQKKNLMFCLKNQTTMFERKLKKYIN